MSHECEYCRKCLEGDMRICAGLLVMAVCWFGFMLTGYQPWTAQ